MKYDKMLKVREKLAPKFLSQVPGHYEERAAGDETYSVFVANKKITVKQMAIELRRRKDTLGSSYRFASLFVDRVIGANKEGPIVKPSKPM